MKCTIIGAGRLGKNIALALSSALHLNSIENEALLRFYKEAALKTLPLTQLSEIIKHKIKASLEKG